jgi:hypothetical protein
MKEKRRRVIVDSAVQWALVRRVLRYGIFVLVMTEILLPLWFAFLSWGIVDSAGGLKEAILSGWQRSLPVLAFFVVIAPILAYDILKLSHRFAGPVYRLHKSIRSLNAGEEVVPIRLRENDFWKDLIDDFNELAEQVATLRKRAAVAGDLEPAACGISASERPWEDAAE